MSFPPGTEMFQFPGFASNPYCIQDLIPSHDQPYESRRPVVRLNFSRHTEGRRWVSPFGNPWIKARSQLPKAYRSVPRPSSPLSAKASTECS